MDRPHTAPRPAAAAPSPDLAPSLCDATALRRHPRFPQAARGAAAVAVEVSQGNRLVSLLLSDRGRFIFGLLILDLHFRAGTGDGDAGLTPTRLKDLCVETGLCSRGRVTAMLAIMRLFGFVAAAPAMRDGRARHLVPTERFIAMHRERWRRMFEVLSSVLTEGEVALRWIDAPGFLAAFVCAMAGRFRAGFRILDGSPVLRAAAERDCGMLILFALFTELPELDAAVPATVPLSIAALSRRFGVSRAHVSTVLTEAERAGLVRRPGTRFPALVLQPSLVDALHAFFATGFLVQAASVRAALEVTRTDSALGPGQIWPSGPEASRMSGLP